MKNHTETLANPEFVAWLDKPEVKEKYQGITREQFNQFYVGAKKQARAIAQAIGLEVDSIDNDTPEVRLQTMLDEKDVFEVNGLLWRHEALDDATQEFYNLE